MAHNSLKILSLSALLALSACATNSTTKSEWDCGAQEGIGCRTILETTSMILGGSTDVSPFAPSLRGNINNGSFDVSGIPKWEKDRILKVYVSPFVDGSNNYHQESIIFSVVKTGGWADDAAQ